MVDSALKALHLEERAIVQSFDVRPLQILHARNPKLRLALLIENLDGFDANLKRLGFLPDAYSPYYIFVNKKLVRKCRSNNIQLVPWTVNDVPSMRRLIRLGVHGIITDYPNLISEVGGE